MKRLTSLLLACLMVLGLSAPAMAAENDATSSTQVFQATATVYGNTDNEGYIKVSVPTTGSILLNPYKVSVEVGGSTSNNQIIFAPQAIKNESPVPLSVQVQAKGAPSSTISLLTSDNATSTSTRQAFLYAEFGTSTSETKQPAWADAYSSSNKSQLAITTSGKTGTVLEKVPAGNTTANYIWFKIAGSMSTPVPNYWDENNSIGVSLTFTFVPQPLESTTSGT